MNFECPSDATEESKIMRITSYRRHPLKSCFYFVLSLISALVVPLVTRWSVNFAVRVKYIPASGKDSEVLVISDFYGVKELIYVKRRPLYIEGQVSTFKTFDYRYQKYYYEESSNMFKPVPAPFSNITCKEICSALSNGISDEATFQQSLMNYGQNIITVQLKSNIMIFIDEILSPFYIFQIFSFILWVFFENYYIYAGILFGTSTTTMIVSVINIKKNLRAIKSQAEYITKIKVRRPYAHHLEAKDYFDTISSTELVPGDVVEINADEPFPCDLVLLSGSVVVDESMLTGESIPIFKETLESLDKPFLMEDFAKNVLFAGTKCLDKKSSKKDNLVKGLVINTGFATTRAKMIKAFLFSPPDKFLASKDSFIFIGGLGLFALIGFCASVSSMVDLGIGVKEIVIKSLDLITTALPPALTTVLAVGTEVSAKRLKFSNILSKSRSKINLAGKVEIMCFDKTGTLTEESLKLKEVHFKIANPKNETTMDRMLDTEIASSLVKSSPQMLNLMAACHSLTNIKNQLRGDPLELDMFQATQWSLVEKNQTYIVSSNGHPGSDASSSTIHILKRFDFVPELQRMSVVGEFDSDNSSQLVYAKGSPEKLLPLCRKDTIPSNIWTLISSSAKEGYRIVACAQKKIQIVNEIQDDRALYESDLEFLGLLSFENQLREASLKTIVKFREAGLRTAMLTGDNPLTSIHAARSCSIVGNDRDVVLASLDKQTETPTILYQLVPHSEPVAAKETSPREKHVDVENKSPLLEDETEIPSFKDQQLFSPVEMSTDIVEDARTGKIALAITGETLTLLQNDPSTRDLYQLFLNKGSVFSRMSPNQKAKVVEALMQQGHIVGMCGDGANDSAALKRAHVGLSIGNGEASLAAPFSTSIKDISSVDILLREGRAALCTSIQCFKYMAMYSVIQTTTMILLYLRRSNLTEWSFNYADMLLNFPLAVGLSFSGPGSKLSSSRPESKLISRYVLTSVIGLGVIQSAFQIVIAVLIPRQDWYVNTRELHPHVSNYADYNLNYDSTCLFVFSAFQYISMAVAFSFGKPHRIPMLKNKVFVIVALSSSILSLFLMFANWSWIKVWMQHMIIPSADFKWILFAIAVANSVINLIFEETCNYMQKKRRNNVVNKKLCYVITND